MISVVIPTLWKAEELKVMLPLVLEHKRVGEVLIINNNVDETPKDLPKNKKLKVFDQKENIFVNPAWNYAIENSRYPRICLMSDDIIFDETIFDKVYDKITEKVGVIGTNPKGIKSFYVKSINAEINPVSEMDEWDGFGTLMFIHKNSYLAIPKEFLIYWGDAWLYDFNAVQGRQNYTIDKFCVKTQMRTSSGLFKSITDLEESIHLEIFDEMYKLYSNKQGKLLTSPICSKVYEMIKEYA